MNELQSLSQIFQNKLFRIPDYQRGYAWLDQQLRDFWEDLINLQPDRYHYTGLLSMKELSRKEAKKLDQEDQWLLESGFKPYHIITCENRTIEQKNLHHGKFPQCKSCLIVKTGCPRIA